MHFGIGGARERFAKRPVGAEELLSFCVVQDDRRSAHLEGRTHLPIKSREVAVLQVGGYREDLELRLDCADLTVDVREQIFCPLSDVLLDLRPLIINGAENGEARERDERHRGHDRQHREPCLNTEAATPHE